MPRRVPCGVTASEAFVDTRSAHAFRAPVESPHPLLTLRLRRAPSRCGGACSVPYPASHAFDDACRAKPVHASPCR
ncbi:hypothetical protein MYA_3185 [Burkholderia sp. KJ006]|nr:hypothetical protein MYA_3185 [Burkholderia sp. KJ006]